jgi:RHS repeat-associated protein
VAALANSAGALQASYRYDPYGRYLSGGGTLASTNVMRFSSKPWVGFAGSATSGLYYYGYRFYDPYLQRWVNRDPLGNRPVVLLWRGLISRAISGELVIGPNLYQFTANDPINHADTDGRIIVPVLKIGGFIVVAWSLWEFLSAIVSGQNNAEIAAHNRELQNDAVSDPRTSFCPTRDRAVRNGLSNLAPDIYGMVTGPGTVAGGPPGVPENAVDAIITIILPVVQPEPETEK